MNILNHFKYPLIILATLLLIICSFFVGSKYALDHLTIRQVTPTQIAGAMKDDHFWVSYREDTLLMSGKVISVSHNGNNTIVGFKTDSPYGAQCSFINATRAISEGQTINVVSVANSAERLKSGVQLNNCIIP